MQELFQAAEHVEGQPPVSFPGTRDLVEGFLHGGALDGGDGVADLADVFAEMASAVPVFKGLNLSKIGDGGVHAVDTDERVPMLEREAERVKQGLIVG